MTSEVHPLLLAAFWSAITVALYCLAKAAYQRWPHLLLSPLVQPCA